MDPWFEAKKAQLEVRSISASVDASPHQSPPMRSVGGLWTLLLDIILWGGSQLVPVRQVLGNVHMGDQKQDGPCQTRESRHTDMEQQT